MASSECAKYDGSEVILLDEYLSRQQLPIFFFSSIGFLSLIFKGERDILGYWNDWVCFNGSWFHAIVMQYFVDRPMIAGRDLDP